MIWEVRFLCGEGGSLPSSLSVIILLMSAFDDLSFTIDFSISGVLWEVVCSVRQEVRRYPGMSYRTVDVFSIEDSWKNILEALDLTKKFYRKVTDQLFCIAVALMQEPGQA